MLGRRTVTPLTPAPPKRTIAGPYQCEDRSRAVDALRQRSIIKTSSETQAAKGGHKQCT